MTRSDWPALSRRAALRLAVGASMLTLRPVRAQGHESFGPLKKPLATGNLRVVSIEQGSTELSTLLRGKVTALQLMFTGCSATCPIQGAVFSEVQRLLRGTPAHLRLLSLSIDPLGDDPKALRAWLKSFGADPARWTGAVIAPESLDGLFSLVGGRSSGADRHTPQVYLFDTQGRLTYRTLDVPRADEVVSLMQQVSQRG